MKKYIIFIMLIFVFSILSVSAEEEIYSAADKVSRRTLDNVERILPDFSFKEAAEEIVHGKFKGGIEEIFENVKKAVLDEIYSSIKILGAITVIGTICAVLAGFQSGFLSEGGKRAVEITCCLLISGLAAAGFSDVAELARSTTDDICIFMMAALPSMGGLSVLGGAVSGIGAIPMSIYAVGITSMIISRICLPAIYISLAMTLAGSVSVRFSLKSAAAIIRKSALWLLGGTVTLSVAIISISSFALSTLNGTAVKGVKFAVSTLVPVLGGALSDAAETVVGSARVLKNAAGAAGMIFLILVLLYPIIKMAVIAFMYKVAGALLNLIAEKNVAGTVTDMGDIAATLAGILVFDGAGMIIMMAAVLNCTNMGAFA